MDDYAFDMMCEQRRGRVAMETVCVAELCSTVFVSKFMWVCSTICLNQAAQCLCAAGSHLRLMFALLDLSSSSVILLLTLTPFPV